MSLIKAYAATTAGGALEPFEHDPGALGREDVESKVRFGGICHSDLSMIDNDWQITAYPIVPGHEVVGEIVALGERIDHLRVGQLVGLGWMSRSCMRCSACLA